jgi:mannose-6-phosphate isomerase-like protein (cupin superfamily)
MKLKLNTYQTRNLNAEDAEIFAEAAEDYLGLPLRIPPRPLRLILIALIVVLAAITISAQRKPSEATRPFVVMSSQSLDDLQKKLHSENKTEELLDSAGMQLRVAVQHEKNRTGAAAELHDASDDVYYVLDGSATLVLGGKLEAPKETDPGEWRSPRIIDGKTFEIKKGDLVVVPRGTPHQRSTANQDFAMILIKIYQEPLKKRT